MLVVEFKEHTISVKVKKRKKYKIIFIFDRGLSVCLCLDVFNVLRLTWVQVYNCEHTPASESLKILLELQLPNPEEGIFISKPAFIPLISHVFYMRWIHTRDNSRGV